MRMIAAVVLLTLVVGTAPAAAQGAAEASDNGRFSFKEVPDGLLRLDTRTGQVSLCSRISEWACRTLADDRAALESEIGRLLDENAALRKQLEARATPPAAAPSAPAPPSAASPPNVLGAPAPQGSPGPQAAPKRSDRDLNLPSDVDVDRMMAFVEKMWRRLLDMAQRTQREFDPDHPGLHKNGI